jgi:hypothetical protein
MQGFRQRMDREDIMWIVVVAGCSLAILAIMIYWSRLRGY